MVLPLSVLGPRLPLLFLAVGCLLMVAAGYLEPFDDVRSLAVYLGLCVFFLIVRQPKNLFRQLLIGLFVAFCAALTVTPYFAEAIYGETRVEPGSTMLFAVSAPRQESWPYGFGAAICLMAFIALLALSIRIVDQHLQDKRLTAEAAEMLKQEELQRRLSDQRSEISGDVHDVLAHSLTVILAQSQAATLLQGDARTQALETVTQVARSSLADVRSLIERLDEPENPNQPAPTLDDLPDLVDTFYTAGLPATLEEIGEPVPLESSTGLAAYRIVQESLTNALKHGGADLPCRVVIDWRGAEPAVCLNIISTLPDDASHNGGGTGRGIEGMKIRAAVAGGWMTVGPDGDAWRVFVSLPTQPADGGSNGAGYACSATPAR